MSRVSPDANWLGEIVKTSWLPRISLRIADSWTTWGLLPRGAHMSELNQSNRYGARQHQNDAGASIDAWRWRRPTWRDPRLFIGIVLVIVSMVAGSVLIDRATSTQQVWALSQDVAPGTALKAGKNLKLVSVNLGSASSAYVQQKQLKADTYAQRSLHSGELLPADATSQQSKLNMRSIVVQSSGQLLNSIRVGDTVELWQLPSRNVAAVAPTPSATKAASTNGARRVAQGLIVDAIGGDQNAIVADKSTSVRVLVPAEQVEPVLTAVGSGAGLVLVNTGSEQ